MRYVKNLLIVVAILLLFAIMILLTDLPNSMKSLILLVPGLVVIVVLISFVRKIEKKNNLSDHNNELSVANRFILRWSFPCGLILLCVWLGLILELKHILILAPAIALISMPIIYLIETIIGKNK